MTTVSESIVAHATEAFSITSKRSIDSPTNAALVILGFAAADTIAVVQQTAPTFSIASNYVRPNTSSVLPLAAVINARLETMATFHTAFSPIAPRICTAATAVRSLDGGHYWLGDSIKIFWVCAELINRIDDSVENPYWPLEWI